jgi:hypothetical protein
LGFLLGIKSENASVTNSVGPKKTIDILVNLDGEQNKMFGENLCAFCMAAVPREMNFIVEP